MCKHIDRVASFNMLRAIRCSRHSHGVNVFKTARTFLTTWEKNKGYFYDLNLHRISVRSPAMFTGDILTRRKESRNKRKQTKTDLYESDVNGRYYTPLYNCDNGAKIYARYYERTTQASEANHIVRPDLVSQLLENEILPTVLQDEDLKLHTSYVRVDEVKKLFDSKAVGTRLDDYKLMKFEVDEERQLTSFLINVLKRKFGTGTKKDLYFSGNIEDSFLYENLSLCEFSTSQPDISAFHYTMISKLFGDSGVVLAATPRILQDPIKGMAVECKKQEIE